MYDMSLKFHNKVFHHYAFLGKTALLTEEKKRKEKKDPTFLLPITYTFEQTNNNKNSSI